MSIHRYTYPDPALAAAACAHHILGVLEEALSGESTAALAISGGTTPRLMFQEMTKARFDWDAVHLFWVDERAVPPADPESNYRMAEECLIRPARIPARNVHRIAAELRPEIAARRYADEIREFFNLTEGGEPHFDVIHRGMGPDAHTASLFPGEPLIDDREGLVAAVYSESRSQWRITMLPRVLLAACKTVMLVTGADKAKALHDIVSDPYDPKRLPAQITSHHGRSVVWFLDDAAASLMD
ncbi:MAG: 6-phosphogluconolactonase [Bryobacteraceae bacterium]